jgi:hypothetical protein
MVEFRIKRSAGIERGERFAARDAGDCRWADKVDASCRDVNRLRRVELKIWPNTILALRAEFSLRGRAD